MTDRIFMAAIPAEETLLRTKLPPFDFSAHDPRDIRALVDRMKRAMHAAQGIGLSANQIGLAFRVFVGQVPSVEGRPKFYAIFNPALEKTMGDATPFEEGCLSVPGVYGEVERPSQIVLRGFDKHGKPVRIKAWGLLARMFQHELDHLDGKLFTDTAKHVHTARPHAH